jgi:hypothetical protein
MSQPLNTDNQTPQRITKAEMEGLLLQLRALAPGRSLSYGESLALARLQAQSLREWAKAQRPDMNLVWLLNQRAVPVSLVASHQLGEESGMTTNAVSGRLEVYLNAAESKQRQRFSLLHEFKHVLDFPDAERLHRRLGNGNRQIQTDQIELICNEFAAHVLMPRRMVVSAWHKTHNLPLLADLFNVSAEAMSTRLTKLGLLGMPRPRPRSYFRLSGPTLSTDGAQEAIAA